MRRVGLPTGFLWAPWRWARRLFASCSPSSAFFPCTSFLPSFSCTIPRFCTEESIWLSCYPGISVTEVSWVSKFMYFAAFLGAGWVCILRHFDKCNCLLLDRIWQLLWFPLSNIFALTAVLIDRCSRSDSNVVCQTGGAGERIESTLSAFRHAYSQGTEMFEVDAQMTADGHVVICHDDDLKRLTGIEGKISETNYAGKC